METIAINIPNNLENCSSPSPELLIYYKELENREIWLDDDVSDYSLDIIKQIILWNQEDKRVDPQNRKPIKIFLWSYGGDLDMAYAIIDTIRSSLTPIWSINMGRCASAAAYIGVSCHKRFMMPHSSYLFHQGHGTMSGTPEQMKAQMKDYEESVEGLSKLMRRYTKYNDEEISKNISTEWYIKCQEALEKGVCDVIIKSINEINCC